MIEYKMSARISCLENELDKYIKYLEDKNIQYSQYTIGADVYGPRLISIPFPPNRSVWLILKELNILLDNDIQEFKDKIDNINVLEIIEDKELKIIKKL